MMDDLAITLQLAAALGVPVRSDELEPVFSIAPELTEWSINAVADPRGTLRIGCFTRQRAAVARAIARLAPDHLALRDALLDDDLEGLGLALREAAPPSVRWWALAGDGDRMADKVRAAWPQHARELDELLAVTGLGTCAAVGVELSGAHRRETVYVRLRTPAAAIRVLERARVPVSRAANLFWSGLCGLEPGGRPWPQVWAARSAGTTSSWKFYYFARGDEVRRTDEVLIEAAGARADAWQIVRRATGEPCVQLVGLTVREGQAPAFTVYLARR